jgi:hypothetical protein
MQMVLKIKDTIKDMEEDIAGIKDIVGIKDMEEGTMQIKVMEEDTVEIRQIKDLVEVIIQIKGMAEETMGIPRIHRSLSPLQTKEIYLG